MPVWDGKSELVIGTWVIIYPRFDGFISRCTFCVAKRLKSGQEVVYDVLASLGGICEPSREYRRVVEAELAEEALAALNAKIASGEIRR
jgi:hypothetical protein